MSAQGILPRYTFPMPPGGNVDLRWLSQFSETVAAYVSGYITTYTTTQRNALTPGGRPAIVFDSTLGKLMLWTGSAWQTVTSA